MVDALTERALVQTSAKKLRHEHIRNLLDLIAGARMPFDANAQIAEFFDPAPDGRACHADFASNFRPADHDHRVVGKHREERVDATISRPSRICQRHYDSGNFRMPEQETIFHPASTPEFASRGACWKLYGHGSPRTFSVYGNAVPLGGRAKIPLELRETLAHFVDLCWPSGERRFEPLHDVFRRAAAKCLVLEPLLLRSNILRETFEVLAQTRNLALDVEGRIIADKQVKVLGGTDDAFCGIKRRLREG